MNLCKGCVEDNYSLKFQSHSPLFPEPIQMGKYPAKGKPQKGLLWGIRPLIGSVCGGGGGAKQQYFFTQNSSVQPETET